MKLDPLHSGDLIDVVAPASRCTDQELKAAVRALVDMGFRPRVPRGLFGRPGTTRMLANTDAERARQLKAALMARDSKLIWCVRGGYGALRIMPEVRRWKKPARPKILLGYSDISTLHAHLNQAWGWPSLHGPLLDRLGRGTMLEKEKRQLFALLEGRLPAVEYGGLKPLNAAARRARAVRGPVLGGNMTVLQSGLGTPSALDPRGAILFFEDLGEKPHRVDRMLAQMAQAGWFARARAVVFGDMLYDDAALSRDIWREAIGRFAAGLRLPVLKGVPAGHHRERQFVVPLNTPAELVTGARGRLVIPSGIRPA